jgi:hypothetical protein
MSSAIDKLSVAPTPGLLEALSDGVRRGIDPNQPYAQLTLSVMAKAIESIRKSIADPITIELAWPSGIPSDVRTTLRAQLTEQLQSNANRIADAHAKSVIEFASTVGRPIIAELRAQKHSGKTRSKRK